MKMMLAPNGRLYAPGIGRFLSREPRAGLAGSCRYARGNPVQCVDPDGDAQAPAQDGASEPPFDPEEIARKAAEVVRKTKAAEKEREKKAENIGKRYAFDAKAKAEGSFSREVAVKIAGKKVKGKVTIRYKAVTNVPYEIPRAWAGEFPLHAEKPGTLEKLDARATGYLLHYKFEVEDKGCCAAFDVTQSAWGVSPWMEGRGPVVRYIPNDLSPVSVKRGEKSVEVVDLPGGEHSQDTDRRRFADGKRVLTWRALCTTEDGKKYVICVDTVGFSFDKRGDACGISHQTQPSQQIPGVVGAPLQPGEHRTTELD